MPCRRASLGVMFALLLAAPRAAAQDGNIREWPFPTPPLPEVPAPARAESHAPPCQDHLVSVQLMLGLENIARLQVEVYHGARWTVMVEAQAGYEAVIIPSFGGGVRFAYRTFDDGDNDAFFISPGLGLLSGRVDRFRDSFWGTVVDGQRNTVALAASVDFSWVHDFTPDFGTELGVQLGLLVPLETWQRVNWGVIPEVSLYAGLRF